MKKTIGSGNKPGRPELAEKARPSIKHRDETDEPDTFRFEPGLFPK